MRGTEKAALEPGEKYGNYQVVDLLAKGGRSFVYKALDTHTGGIVALQTVVMRLDDKQRARVENVRSRLTQLQHPSLARVFDVGLADGKLWLATEFVRGRTVEKELATRGPLPLREVAGIGRQIASALAAAHAARLVHRSLKPSNVLLLEEDGDHREVVKLLDTGLWTILCGGGPGTLATPESMSPEECRGGLADARSDVYSLGVLMFQLLTGRGPFDAATLDEMKEAHLNRTPPRLRTQKPSAEPMEGIVNRCLLKRADDRFQTMQELVTALGDVIAAPERPLILSLSDQPAPPLPMGGTWEVVSPQESRTLAEGDRRILRSLPPESPRAVSAPLQVTTAKSSDSSRNAFRPPVGTRPRDGRRLLPWIVAVLVVVAWAIVGLIAWRRQ